MSTVSAIESKVMDLATLLRTVAAWRVKGGTVIFTNGCFDILHKGHVRYLAEAADMGAWLIVGLNSDASVKRQGKGDNRPLNDEQSRAAVLAGLQGVDAVCVFDEDTPLEMIAAVLPDILVKGGDYDAHETNKNAATYIVGSEEVKKNGGRVATIQFVEGYSTTSVIRKIQSGR